MSLLIFQRECVTLLVLRVTFRFEGVWASLFVGTGGVAIMMVSPTVVQPRARQLSTLVRKCTDLAEDGVEQTRCEEEVILLGIDSSVLGIVQAFKYFLVGPERVVAAVSMRIRLRLSAIGGVLWVLRVRLEARTMIVFIAVESSPRRYGYTILAFIALGAKMMRCVSIRAV
nr:hypothetical protein Iba_chr10eCG9880 [Ipomoea batatas]